MHRQVNVRSFAGVDSQEGRRRHSCHGEGNAVDQDGMSDGVGGASEAPLSDPVT
jgi:hypothetical protein